MGTATAITLWAKRTRRTYTSVRFAVNVSPPAVSQKMKAAKALQIQIFQVFQKKSQKNPKKISKSTCQILSFRLLLVFRAFLSSSVVERSAVNRLVAGSNPAWGVK